MTSTPATLLDLDGTLVDSVPHHVVAWQAALAAAGYRVPTTHIHAGIGMGGDRLLPWLLGGHVDDADELRADHARRFLATADTLQATPGASALLADLRVREVPFVVATSAGGDTRQALLDVLGEPDLPMAGAGDDGASKPSPDLLLTACEMIDADPASAVLVGDAPWDSRAAARAGMRSIAVRCGGFSDATLRGAGAGQIVDAPRDLLGQL
jgi:HAD superfamily hydrolase (TIGR01509 family)